MNTVIDTPNNNGTWDDYCPPTTSRSTWEVRKSYDLLADAEDGSLIVATTKPYKSVLEPYDKKHNSSRQPGTVLVKSHAASDSEIAPPAVVSYSDIASWESLLLNGIEAAAAGHSNSMKPLVFMLNEKPPQFIEGKQVPDNYWVENAGYVRTHALHFE